MLSVINRGSVVGDSGNGLPYRIVNGYMPNCYDGVPLSLIKLSGIPTPLEIEVTPQIKTGYLARQETIVTDSMGLYSIPLTPVIKNGYTPKTIEPTRR